MPKKPYAIAYNEHFQKSETGIAYDFKIVYNEFFPVVVLVISCVVLRWDFNSSFRNY